MIESVLEFLKMNDVEYKEDQDLKKLSPIKIGANAHLVAFPDTEKKLVSVLRFLNKNKIRHKILGRMSNVLPPDEDYTGVLIKTDRVRSVTVGEYVFVSAGITMQQLARLFLNLGFSGVEELCGIPSSLGGAVYGNAGAFGREMGDILSRVRYYDYDTDSVVLLDAESMDLGYRSSIFQSMNGCILSVLLKPTVSGRCEIEARMHQCRELRRTMQPTGELSLGSVFKKPSVQVSAAKLIDECGLKGYRIGGARISEKHAGFIVNSGGAAASDYLSLAALAESAVYERFGIRLEREVEIL